MSRKLLLAFTVAFAMSAALTEAAVINGGFETGDFTGWSTIGVTSVEDNSFGTGPTEGTFQALMTTDAGSAAAADVASFLNLTPAQFSALSAGLELEGSAIKQTVSGNTGDVLSFDWKFLTNETMSAPPEDDFAFWSLVSENSGVVLATVNGSTLGSSGTVFDTETGYFTTTYNLTSTGSFTLGFGVTDVNDIAFSSGLLIDNVSITASSSAIPEPGCLALTGIGVCGLFIQKRHRRTKV